MHSPSDVDRAFWILQSKCPGCGQDLLPDKITHCRNALCPDAHAALRRAINSSVTLQDLEMQELAQGRSLYDTLSIVWFDNYER